MKNKEIKKKFIFLGETDSINIEIILNSHSYLKNKIKYLIICNKFDLKKYIKKSKSKLEINEIFDPINFTNFNKNSLNVFNISPKYKEKYKNLLNQLNISNYLSNSTGFDLITMPIDKSLFKKKIKFIGVTEYLGKINNTNTAMLMYGERFSVLPLTTHINLKNVYKNLNEKKLKAQLDLILKFIKLKKYKLTFKSIKFLCYNPHCGEDKTIGKEDNLITKTIKNNFKKISGPYPSDSAFNKLDKNTLFISTYHDQALIPFKILNKNGVNMTLGLIYRRISPAHGTAKDLKFKNKSDNKSFIKCMTI